MSTETTVHETGGMRGWLLRHRLGEIRAPGMLALDEMAICPGLPLTVGVVLEVPLSDRPTEDFAIDMPPTAALSIQFPTGETELVSEADGLWPEDLVATEDCFRPLGRAAVDGTIYLKESVQEPLPGFLQGERARGDERVRITTPSQKQASTQGPQGLNLFELLLPILLPPEKPGILEGLLLPKPLYPFQNGGVAFLTSQEAALLADDMGLGKTVQGIVALRLLVRTGRIRGSLIVCNKAVVPQWKRHLEDWAPDLVCHSVEGSRERRQALWEAFAAPTGLRCHVLLATYETVRQDQQLLSGRQFDLMVLDEIQRIKNQDIGITRAVRSIHAKRRWGLSGTPLENRVEDLHSIFSFLKPGLLKEHDLSPAVVRDKIEPYFLRRRKEDALDLPPKIVDDQWLELTDAQRESYDRAKQEGVVQLKSGHAVTVQHVLALITKLKQICNFDPATGESEKAKFILSRLEEVCEGGHKALVFSQYVESLKMLQERLEQYVPLLYTGQLSDRQRLDILERFKSDTEAKVLLLSLKAGGVGLDLPQANFVFHYDLWWNPAVQRQAEGRADRIGQSKTVFVRRLLMLHTIEEDIEKILLRKARLFDETIEGLADVDLRQSLTEEELFGLFGLKPPRAVEREEADQQWSAVDADAFERNVANVYEAMGFRTRVTKRTRDGGVDIEAWKEDPTGAQRVLIQCKHWPGGTVGEEQVRDLYGVLSSRQDIHRAILVTSGRFSDSARRWAQGKRVDLVDGVRLQALMASMRA